MSKNLLHIFSFKQAKIFLDIIEFQINDRIFENNIFAHPSNPLLGMCLMYELLTLIIKKFFSLNNICRVLMSKTMEMALSYI